MTLKYTTVLVLTVFYSMMPSRISRHNNGHCCNEPTRGAVPARLRAYVVRLRMLTSATQALAVLCNNNTNGSVRKCVCTHFVVEVDWREPLPPLNIETGTSFL